MPWDSLIQILATWAFVFHATDPYTINEMVNDPHSYPVMNSNVLSLAYYSTSKIELKKHFHSGKPLKNDFLY